MVKRYQSERQGDGEVWRHQRIMPMPMPMPVAVARDSRFRLKLWVLRDEAAVRVALVA